MGEAQEFIATATREREWRSRFTPKVHSHWESRGIGGNRATGRERCMERATDQVGEALRDDARISSAQFKVGEDAKSDRRVRIKGGTCEPRNVFSAREAEELFNICRAQRINARREELVKHRFGVAHPPIGESGEQRNRIGLRVATLALEDVHELRSDLLLRDGAEVESLQSREDRWSNLGRVGGAEDEDDSGRRLFKPLEQRVPGVIGESMHLIKDQHLALQICGWIGDQRDQILTHVVDAV